LYYNFTWEISIQAINKRDKSLNHMMYRQLREMLDDSNIEKNGHHFYQLLVTDSAIKHQP